MKIMIEKVKIENSNVWDSQNGEFQWSEKKNLQFQCLQKKQNPEFQCLKKATILNSNIWKSQNRNWIPVYGRKKSSTPNVWKSQNTEIVCLENKKIVNSNVL